jgi:subfamily B ATP-binding cassette protein MsbA
MSALGTLLARARNYKGLVAAAIVSNILLSILTVASVPLIVPFLQILFDQVPPVTDLPAQPSPTDHINYYMSRLIIDHGKQHALLTVCGSIIGVFFLKNVFRYLSLFFVAPLRNGILRDIRGDLYKQYMHLPLSFFADKKKGDLLSRLTVDIVEVERSILDAIEAVFKSPLVIIGCIGYMLWESPALTLFVFVLLIFVTVIIGGISRTLKKSSHKAQGLLGELNAIAEESLGGIRIIKGFGAEDYFTDKYRATNDQHRDTLTKLVWRRDLSGPLSEFLGIVTVTVLLWFGSKQVFAGDLAPATFFAFLFAFFQVIEPSKSFSKAYYNVQKGLAALDRVEDFVQTPNHIADSSGDQQASGLKQQISLRSVGFKYISDGQQVLDGIDLDINKGEVVALVGPSGAGKTTLADLIPRFYDVTAGAIKIDGIDIRTLSLDSLRSLFGIVSQDAILFNDTIRKNIDLGNNYSEQAIQRAVEIAHASDFVAALPQGYDTLVGDRGALLSGGQRQRLTIARAVAGDPPILILDEATSALDAESELMVQQALEQVMVGRTTIVIAHRLSTIRAADKIVVIDSGRVLEVGNHDDLVSAGGAYAKLVEMQSFS